VKVLTDAPLRMSAPGPVFCKPSVPAVTLSITSVRPDWVTLIAGVPEATSSVRGLPPVMSRLLDEVTSSVKVMLPMVWGAARVIV